MNCASANADTRQRLRESAGHERGAPSSSDAQSSDHAPETTKTIDTLLDRVAALEAEREALLRNGSAEVKHSGRHALSFAVELIKANFIACLCFPRSLLSAKVANFHRSRP